MTTDTITAKKTWENGYTETREFQIDEFDEMIAWFQVDPDAGIFTSCEDCAMDKDIWDRVQESFRDAA